jgi:hypothetical protein
VVILKFEEVENSVDFLLVGCRFHLLKLTPGIFEWKNSAKLQQNLSGAGVNEIDLLSPDACA